MGETIRIKDLPEKQSLSSDDLFVNSDTITTTKVTAGQIADYVAQSDEIGSVVVKKEDVGQPLGVAPLDAGGRIDGTYITYGTADFTAFPGSEGKKLKENKVDKIEGKGLSSNDFTDEEKSKLAGIAAEANKYTHPDTHPAGMIHQDAEHRFVTDAEKDEWNATLTTANSYSDINYQQATGYTDAKIAALINGAPTTLDTLKEIADAMEENQNVVAALEEAIGSKSNESEFDSHVKDKSNPHNVTKAQLGLENVADERQYSASNPQPSVAGSSGSCTGNAATATKWQTARNINGMSIDGSTNRTNYGTCTTTATTAAKTVSCEGFALVTGAEITVYFTFGSSADNPTLNVNGTGAKPIFYKGSTINRYLIKEKNTYTFRYNGAHYDVVGEIGTMYQNSSNNYVAYDSQDEAEPSAWTDILIDTTTSEDASGSNNTLGAICKRISTMFKNVRYLYKILGTTDISAYGDGTVTGALEKAFNPGYSLYNAAYVLQQEDFSSTGHTKKLVTIPVTEDGYYFVSATIYGYTYNNSGRLGQSAAVLRNGTNTGNIFISNNPVFGANQYLTHQLSGIAIAQKGDEIVLTMYVAFPYNSVYPEAVKLLYTIVKIV